MRLFTIFSIAVVITLNSCSSSKKSTSSNDYYSTNDQYLKFKTHKRVDWKYFDDYDKYPSSGVAPAPLYHLGIVPFGIYGGVMRIPIFYYDPYDYYRDVALNALDLYNNPSNYLLRYYSWNEYYNPYYFTGIPNNLDMAFNTSVNIYPTNQYGQPSGYSINNNITSLYSGQIRNTNDIRKILNYVRTSNTNNAVGLFKISGNNRLAINARYNTRNNFPTNKTAGNNSKSNNNSFKNTTYANNRYQTEPVRNFTPVSFPNSNSNAGVIPTANNNSGSNMPAPEPVSRVR